MIRNRHTHPLTILENVRRFLFILLLPLARGFILALQGGFRAWLEGSWFDILVLLLLLGCSAVEWHLRTFSFGEEGLTLQRGLFLRRKLFLPLSSITTVSVVRPFFLRPLRVATVHADTAAGGRGRADISILLSLADANLILAAREHALNPVAFTKREYRPQSAYVAFLAACNASSAAGIAFLVTFISQTGRLLGDRFSEMIYGTFERFTLLLAFGVPPTAAALAYLILFGWLIAFLLNLLRYNNFRLQRQSGALRIHSGLFTLRRYCVAVRDINFLDLRTGVLTRLFGINTLVIHAVGYGKRRDDISTLALARKRDTEATISMIVPELPLSPRQLTPHWPSIFKFINDPFWPCLLIPVAAYLLGRFFPDWSSFSSWMGFMLSVPAWWLMIVRLMDFFTSGISCQGDIFTLRYSHFYKLHTVAIHRSRIAKVCLRQSLLQRGDDRCDVLVYSFAEGSTRHHIKNIDRKAAAALFGIDLLK